ncbi:MAG: hypothetical protein ACYC36_02440 [Bellilinea sp.]
MSIDFADIDNFPTRLTEPAKSVAPINPHDPAQLGYPATFPIEIAMRTSGTRSICEAYGITEEEWNLIRHDPTFLSDLQRAVDMLKEEGMSFKLKARLQSEELLKTSWRMIHHPDTPPNVKADLIKSTARWAGFDTPTAVQQGSGGSGFSISINFAGDKPDLKTINGPY